MGCRDDLCRMLAPLGVYALEENSLSGASLSALGAALDELEAAAAEGLRESSPLTAEDSGLRKAESLFPFAPVGETLQARRAAVCGFWQVGGDSFTAEALNRCLAACGTACTVEETETPGRVRVRFPETMGIPPRFEARKRIAEAILPCHLDIEYALRWCTWAQTQAAGKTWDDLAALSWDEWALTEEF